MSCRNSFGYRDPTAGRAIGNVLREKKRQQRNVESPEPHHPETAAHFLAMTCFEKIRQADELVKRLRYKLDIAP